jgi:hypothetical protein
MPKETKPKTTPRRPVRKLAAEAARLAGGERTEAPRKTGRPPGRIGDRIGVYVPPDLLEWVEMHAIRESRRRFDRKRKVSVSEIVTEALRAYREKHAGDEE